jgi:hypothetical protein
VRRTVGYYSLRCYSFRYYKRFFEEGAKIGSGSFGSVFVCRHKLDGEVLGQVCHARTVGHAIEALSYGFVRRSVRRE